eukprot:tig00000215_g18600.t1
MDAMAIIQEAEAKYKPAMTERELDLQFDLGNLACFDPGPLDAKALKSSKKDEYLKSHARDCVQLLLNKLFELPTRSAEVGRVAELPPPTTVLPREKPIPKGKAKTKWQKFAEQKGIVKRKRGRMEFDDATGEWKPRWGYGRAAREETDAWVIPAKQGEDPSQDPFDKRAEAKREKMSKQEKRRMENLKRAGVLPKGTPASVELSTSIPEKKTKKAPLEKKRVGKDKVEEALKLAQTATASVGRFDKKLDAEPDAHRGKRRKFDAVVAPKAQGKAERAKSLGVLEKIVGSGPEIDTDAAANRYNAAQDRERAEKKERDGGYRKKSKDTKAKKRAPKGGKAKGGRKGKGDD